MRPITLQDVTDWTLGVASDDTCHAIAADLERTNSLVREYLEWEGNEANRPTPRLVQQHFSSVPTEARLAQEDVEEDLSHEADGNIEPLNAGVERSPESTSPHRVTLIGVGRRALKGIWLCITGVFFVYRVTYVMIMFPVNVALRIAAWLYSGLRRIAFEAVQFLTRNDRDRLAPQSRHRTSPYRGWSFPSRPGDVSLIECLTLTCVLGLCTMLMLPAVQSARNASRRSQCANNLKQLAIAAYNYAEAHGCFPSGSYSGTLFNPPHWDGHPENFSCFVRLLPYYYYGEQALYNSVNFTLCSSAPANLTISATVLNTLICPSDPSNQAIALPATQASNGVSPGWQFNQLYPLPPGTWSQTFTSYAGNAGTFTFGFSNLMPPEVLGHYNGVIYNDSHVSMSDVTDGMSNTFLFAERAKGHRYILKPATAVSDNAWNSGLWNDTLFSTLYPLNMASDGKARWGFAHYSPTAAGSYHPGGANFAFCDGSVHFVKTTVNTWPFRTYNSTAAGYMMPDNTTYITVTATPPYTQPGSYLVHHGSVDPEKRSVLGVYQLLSTRNGGEYIPVDTYEESE